MDVIDKKLTNIDAIEQKLIQWYRHPAIQAKRWAPNLFWAQNEKGENFARLKVDAAELEVLFATILNEPSEYLERLDRDNDGRGTFIAINARRHELPLLTRNTNK